MVFDTKPALVHENSFRRFATSSIQWKLGRPSKKLPSDPLMYSVLFRVPRLSFFSRGGKIGYDHGTADFVIRTLGEVAEWSNVPDSKSGVPKGTGGSNPSLSATPGSNYLKISIRKRR